MKPELKGSAGEMLIYQMPDLKLVDLSWAGRLSHGNPALRAIIDARVGDSIALASENGEWLIRDDKGQKIGRMARAWSPPEGRHLKRGEVGAIIRWRKADSKEEYHDHLRRDEWEAVLPEFVFE